MPRNNRETLACNKLKGPKATPVHEEGLSSVNDESKIPKKRAREQCELGMRYVLPRIMNDTLRDSNCTSSATKFQKFRILPKTCFDSE